MGGEGSWESKGVRDTEREREREKEGGHKATVQRR